MLWTAKRGRVGRRRIGARRRPADAEGRGRRRRTRASRANSFGVEAQYGEAVKMALSARARASGINGTVRRGGGGGRSSNGGARVRFSTGARERRGARVRVRVLPLIHAEGTGEGVRRRWGVRHGASACGRYRRKEMPFLQIPPCLLFPFCFFFI